MESDKPNEPSPIDQDRLMGQYVEIEQPDGSVIEMHVMRLVRGGETIPLICRCKAVDSE